MEWASLVAIDSLVFVASLVITRLDHLLPISVRIGLDFDPGRAEKRPFNAIQCHSMPLNPKGHEMGPRNGSPESKSNEKGGKKGNWTSACLPLAVVCELSQ